MSSTANCPLCKLPKRPDQFVSGKLLRPRIVELIQRDHPDWQPDQLICRTDLNHYRALSIEEMLQSEKGEISKLDQQVIDSIRQQDILAKNLNDHFADQLSLGERLADRIAEFGGSWGFISLFAAVLFSWIGINIWLLSHPFDPYPFILLNLLLSCLAAIQAPVIMMSQNRQEAKDRLRAEEDYRINLKAELEIRQLHEKLDHILLQQWERMLEIQQMQVEMMNEIAERKA